MRITPSTRFVAHPGVWLVGWIIAHAAGYAIGIALWQTTYPAIRLTLGAAVGGFALIAGFGVTVGLCVGLAQAIMLRQGLARTGAWVLATAIGGAVGFVVAAWASEALNDALETRMGIPLTDAVLVLVFGATIGAGIGVSQWLILRAQGISITRWPLASTLGLLIGYPLAIGVIELLPSLDQPFVGLAFGACAGATAALIQWLIARRQIAWHWRAN